MYIVWNFDNLQSKRLDKCTLIKASVSACLRTSCKARVLDWLPTWIT